MVDEVAIVDDIVPDVEDMVELNELAEETIAT